MKIQFKLILVGFVVIAVLMAVVGFVTVRAFQKISQDTNFVFTVVDPMNDAVSDLRIAFEEEIRAVEEYAGDFFTLEAANEEIEESEKIIQENFEKLESAAAAAAAAGLVTIEDINKLRKIIAEEDELREEVFRLKIAAVNKAQAATSTVFIKGAIGGELREKLEEFDEIVEDIDEVTNSMRASILSVKETRQQEVAAAAAAGRILTVGVIASALLALGMGVFVSRQVAKPLRELRDVADAVAKGDLTKRAEVKGQDEIGQLAATFNKMTESLLEARRLPENILRSMKDSLFVVDTKGNITEVNQAALDVLGYKKEELVGAPISKVFGRVARGSTRNLTQKDAEDEKPKVIKYVPAPDDDQNEES